MPKDYRPKWMMLFIFNGSDVVVLVV